MSDVVILPLKMKEWGERNTLEDVKGSVKRKAELSFQDTETLALY